MEVNPPEETTEIVLTELRAVSLLTLFKLPLDEKAEYFLAHPKFSGRITIAAKRVTGKLQPNISDDDFTYYFSKCIFEDEVSFSSGSSSCQLIFDECVFQKGVTFKGTFNGYISLEKCFSRSVILYGGSYKDVVISLRGGSIFVSNNIEFGQINIGGNEGHEAHFEQVSLDLTSVKGNIVITHSFCNVFTISGIADSGLQLSAYDLHVFQVEFDSFSNDAEIVINNLEAHTSGRLRPTNKTIDDYNPLEENEFVRNEDPLNDTLFSVVQSDLSRVKFLNLNLAKFNSVYIEESALSDVSFYNVIWPRYIKVDGSSIYFHDDREVRKKSIVEYSKLERENYRQLKFASSKHQDYISEQFFHGLEMRSYDRTLTWTSNFWTKIILRLSLLTSDFGQSVIRPLVSIVLINGFLFYFLYLTGDGPFKSYDFTKGENYVNTAAEFIRVVNPLHKNEPELRGWAFIIDVMIRICSSYFIYNLIRATRRFVK